MLNSNALHTITGLVFVGVFLLMLAFFGHLSKVVQGPFVAPTEAPIAWPK
jgi:hypothetical protein